MNIVVHNETSDGRWYWLVERESEDKTHWLLVETGYEDTEEEAQMKANVASGLINDIFAEELRRSSEFGNRLLFAFERQAMSVGINSSQEEAERLDAFLLPVSYALERGRLHIACQRILKALEIEEAIRPGLPLTSDAALKAIYNEIAIFINIPTI